MGTVLKRGDRGSAVEDLQMKLRVAGYAVSADGIFGGDTEKAVRDFQASKALVVDGKVGPATLAELAKSATVPAKWEAIPFPTANKSRSAAMPTLNAVGAMTGTDPRLLATFASIESAFDYTVKASTSSATGWFQFLDATWDDIIKAHGSKYGLPKDPTRALRKDPRANALMGAEFLKGNAAVLRPVVNREPSDTDLYLAHFLGAGGAKKFLSADQKTLGEVLFPKPAKANPSIFSNKGVPRTLAEIYKLFEDKVSKHRA